jgi:hypothetical protein
VTGSAVSPAPDRIGRKDVIAMAALVLVGVGIPLWLAASAGVIGLPSNDDWVYMRAATNLYRDGVIDVPGHSASFVGQLGLVQPFLWLSRGEPWGFHAFGLAMTAIGLVATYLLARRFVGIGAAVFVVLLILATPGFARESVSFMTDVPAFSLAMLCLLLGTLSLQGVGVRWTLVGSVVIGVIAVSIREFMIAAPIAILAVAWIRSHGRERIWLAVLSLLLAIGVVAVLRVSGSVSGHGGPTSLRPLGLIDLGPAFATLAAILLPVTLLFVVPRLRSVSAGLVIVAAALGCLLVLDPDGPLLGNLWTESGLGADQLLTGSRDPILGPAAWQFSRQLALFAAILAAIVGLVWAQRHFAGVRSISSARRRVIDIARSREAPLILFLVGYAGELILYGLVGGLFDRYLYPMVPVAAILVLRWTSQPFGTGRTHALAHLAFAWLAVSAFLIAANSVAYDAARNREGEAAIAMGYDPQTVDAGYEWVGSHGTGTQQVFDPTGLNWWQAIWTSFRPCAVLSNSQEELDGFRLIRANESAYRQFLLFGPDEPLYLYAALTGNCPDPPPAVDGTSLAPIDESWVLVPWL